MKKTISLILGMLSVLCMLFCVACGQEDVKQGSLTLDKTEITMTAGDTALITPTLKDAEGTIVWTSSNEKIATVKNGTVTAVKYGSAIVKATVGELSAECTVTVNQLEVFCEEIGMEKGATDTLKPSVKYNGKSVDATYAYVSDKPEIISVTEDGTVSSLKSGRANVTITATYGEYTAQTTVSVVSALDISIAANVDIVTLATGNILKGDYIGSQDLSVTLTKNEEPVSATFVWTSLDDGIATVTVEESDSSRAVVKAVGVGSTMVVATFEYDGSEIDVTFTVNCEMPVYEANDFTVDLSENSDATKITVQVPAEFRVDEIDEIVYNNKALTIDSKDTESNTVTLKEASFVLGVSEIKVRTGLTLYGADLVCATMVIKNKADFMTFLENYANNVEGEYYALAANIDLDGLDITPYTGHVTTEEGTTIFDWNAMFDGRGYALINAQYTHGIFRQVRSAAVIENLAIVNPIKKTNGGGLIANELFGTIRNCFVYGTLTAVGQGAFCMTEYAGSTVENCVAIVENADGVTGGYAAINNLAAGTNNRNYVVSATRSAGMYAGEEVTSGLYASVSEFLAAENDLSSFTNKWETVGGFPILKHAIDAIGWDSLEITNTADVLFSGDEIYANKKEAVFFLKEEVDGVTIVDGIVSIADTVANDTQIIVVASVLGKYTAEKTFTLKTFVDKTEIEYVLSQTATSEIDLDKIGEVTGASVTSLIINGSVTAFTADGNKLTVAAENIGTLTIGSATVTIVTTDKTYKASGFVATAVIDTVAEFQEIFKAGLDSANKYYILGANLDFEGTDITSNTGYAGCGAFKGTLDGRGYAIVNAKYTHGLFASVAASGVVKNLAIVNPVKAANGGGLIANELGGKIYNCFVYGTFTAVNHGAFCMTEYATGSVENCIAFVENAAGVTGGYAAIGATTSGSYADNYVISSSRTGLYAGKTDNEGLYADIESFLAAELDFTSLGSEWQLVEGLPVFKSAIDAIGWSSVRITNASEILYNGSVITASSREAVFFLKEEVDGVTIVDGIVSIADMVANDTQITVVASVLGKYTAEKTFTLKTFVDKTEIEYVLSQTATSEIDLDKIGEVTGASVTSLIINGSVTAFAADGNKLTVTASDIAALAHGSATVTIVTTDKTYKASGFVATAVIDTVAEFQEIFKAGLDSANKYYILGANLDFEGTDITSNTGYAGCSTFKGTLDGRGYAIVNAKYTHGLFASVAASGVVKNLALINPVKAVNGGGLIANECYGSVENCFVYGALTADAHYGIAPNGTPNVSNCLAMITGTTGSGSAVANGANTSDTIAISSLAFAAAGDNGNELYATVSAFEAVHGDLATYIKTVLGLTGVSLDFLNETQA